MQPSGARVSLSNGSRVQVEQWHERRVRVRTHRQASDPEAERAHPEVDHSRLDVQEVDQVSGDEDEGGGVEDVEVVA